MVRLGRRSGPPSSGWPILPLLAAGRGVREVTGASMPEWWRDVCRLDGVGGAGGVRVVHVDLSPDAAREAEAVSWLDADESERWRRYRHPGPRRRFALCRAVLRAILCGRLGCSSGQLAFAVSAYGKPHARVDGAAAPVSFNVSHSGEHGLIAFASRGRIGVDVQVRAPRRNLDLLIEGVMSSRERAELAELRGDDRLRLFSALWTVKEALSKARGRGLSMGVSGFEVPAGLLRGAGSGLFRFDDMPNVAWRVDDLGNSAFAAALACEVDSISLRCQ